MISGFVTEPLLPIIAVIDCITGKVKSLTTLLTHSVMHEHSAITAWWLSSQYAITGKPLHSVISNDCIYFFLFDVI